jgi:outer membrane factor, OMF family
MHPVSSQHHQGLNISTSTRTSRPGWVQALSLVLLSSWTAASGLPAWSQTPLPSLSPRNTAAPGVAVPAPTRTPPQANCNATELPAIPARPADAAVLPPLEVPTTGLSVPKTSGDVAITTTAPITLEQTIELARSRNRNLQIAILQVTQQKEALRQIRASLYPAVTVQAGVTRSDSAQSAIAAKRVGVPRPNAANNLSGSLNLNYDIFTSGQRPATIRAAEAALRSAEQSYRTQFQQLRLDAASAYYDLQQAGDLIRIARQSVTSAEENLRVTTARETAGIGTRFEVLQAEVSLANFKQQLIQSISQQQVAQRNLAQLLSLPPNTNISAADSVAIVGEWSPTLESSIVGALQNRSELAQVLEQRQIALQNRKVALGSLGPQVGFNSNIELADSLNDSQTGSLGYGLGAQVTKTIFDGGSAKAIAAQQQTNAVIAETQFASYKNLIRFQVEQNYYTLQSSREQILTTRCAIEQARQGLDLAKLRRNYGVGTSLDVSNAETALSQAENNYLQAIVSYNRSLSSLRRFVGQ